MWPLPEPVKTVLRAGDRVRLRFVHAMTTSAAASGRFFNEVEVRAFGLKRSGNHVIINWILLNHPGTVCFLNYIRDDRHFNPLLSFGQSFLKHEEEVLNYPPRLRSKVRRTRDWFRHHPRKDCLIYSYEDRPLASVPDDALARQHDRCLGRSGTVRNVLILRDPFNTFASRLKGKGTLQAHQVGMWKEYAREFLGETDFLGSDRIAISYNRWCSDVGYRADLARRLGLEGAERGVDQVPNIGGGSSFDSTAFDGRASAMPTAERWRAFENDAAYRGVFSDRELVDLSKRIFGHLPGTERLLNAP